MRSKKEPCYDLAKVQRLVKQNKYRTSKKVRSYLRDHGYDPAGTVEDVICSIELKHHYKTDELNNIPGTFADIYRHVGCYGEEWYVKFFFENDNDQLVVIWSLKEDGYPY